MRSYITLDLSAVVADEVNLDDGAFHWPTSYSEYTFLSTCFVDEISAAARAAANTPELEAVVESKLYDTTTDLALIARLALDIRNARREGKRLAYDPAVSRWLAFLDEGGTEAAAIASLPRWHHRRPQSSLSQLRRWTWRQRSRILSIVSPLAGRHDVLSRNRLLNKYFAIGGAREIDVSPNYHDWPAPMETPQVRGLVNAMVSAFADAVHPATNDDVALAKTARILATAVVGRHLGKAWSDLQQVQQLIKHRHAGGILAGGTPKHIGRIFSWQYQQLGRQVIRFAHGGERAFYDDYPWSLAELPFCDRYICHSRGEAAHLERRRAEGRIAAAGLDSMTFESLPALPGNGRANLDHGPQKRARNKTVMYVAGGYLGETLSDFPSRKPPDVIYLAWQIWLLRTLRSLGWRVLTKGHPRGVFADKAILRRHSDGMVSGNFDPDSHDVDCYVFDFAGAAFFEALASNRGLVLLDMGVRPRDAVAFDDLRQRCEIVACDVEDGNKFRLDKDALAGAIERASTARDWPARFFETYVPET